MALEDLQHGRYHPTPNERVEQALPSAPKKSLLSRLGIVGIVSVLAAILIIGSALYVFSGIASSKKQSNLGATTLSHIRPTHTTIPPTPAVTPIPQNGLYIPGTYNGSMYNSTTQQTTSITTN